MHCVTKILKVGGSYTVVIPKKFMEDMKLEKGDLVFINKEDNVLLVYRFDDIIGNKDKVDKGGNNVIDR